MDLDIYNIRGWIPFFTSFVVTTTIGLLRPVLASYKTKSYVVLATNPLLVGVQRNEQVPWGTCQVSNLVLFG